MTDPVSPPTPDWPPRVVVWIGAIVLSGKRVLCVRQASGHPMAGEWTFPGGLLQPDETPEVAALRETLEEANVVARLTGLIGVQSVPPPYQGWLAMAFLGEHVSGAPAGDGVETDRAAYLSLDELETLGEPFEPWSGWLVRRVLAGDYTLLAPTGDQPYAPFVGFF